MNSTVHNSAAPDAQDSARLVGVSGRPPVRTVTHFPAVVAPVVGSVRVEVVRRVRLHDLPFTVQTRYTCKSPQMCEPVIAFNATYATMSWSACRSDT